MLSDQKVLDSKTTDAVSSATDDRRSEPRHETIIRNCRVGWWEDTSFRTTPALILNISGGGMGLTADSIPPEADALVYIFLDRPGLRDWMEAKLVQVQHLPGGLKTLRLRFTEPCPDAFLQQAVFGRDVIRTEDC